MIQNKAANVQSRLMIWSQHVHTSEVGVVTFDLHSMFRKSVKLLAHNERFISPIWHSRSIGPLDGRGKRNMKKLNQPRVFAKPPENSFITFILYTYVLNCFHTSMPGILTTTYRFKNTRSLKPEQRRGKEEQIDRVDEFFTVRPGGRVGKYRNSWTVFQLS